MIMFSKGLAHLLQELVQLTQTSANMMSCLNNDGADPQEVADLMCQVQEEMGGVLAACVFVQERLDLDEAAIKERATAKLALIKELNASRTFKLARQTF
jgi:hypothetical protein